MNLTGPWAKSCSVFATTELNKPRYRAARDLNPDWIDLKHPNGTTILAPDKQPSSMEYPGGMPNTFRQRSRPFQPRKRLF